ncbi:MAG: hypothetical protein GQ527_06600 [Bacteroidales bacterium]|nr:hypothetical protein [Bacteroidales bacterium]
MQDKQKFYLFLAIILLLILSIGLWKYYSHPSIVYSKKEIILDFSGKKNISDKKQQFMEDIVRASQLANYHISKEKKRLKKINQYFISYSKISSSHQSSLVRIAEKFGIKGVQALSDSISISKFLGELSKRVEIVPVRLALAQAILESAWGTSRFAKEGNAYFGIHCYSEGCGLSFGDSDHKVFVKSYDNMQASVNDYLLFLNSKRGVRKFRNARQEYFSSSDHDIFKLGASLSSYSEIGGEYQEILNSLFRNYIPNHIDDY